MATKKSKKPEMITRNGALAFAFVALLMGWVLGYVVASTSDDDEPETTARTEKLEDHKHGLYEVAAENAPAVQVLAEEDELGGWNVTLVTENFEFTPTAVNEEDVEGTGHAHIWVDGEKIGRVYSNYYHLPSLGAGEHEITVTLNTNMHMDYAVDGEEVRGTINVTESGDSGDGHSHGSDKKSDTHMDDDHSHDDDDDHSHSN